MKTYTNEEQTEIGKEIAKLFRLKKDRKYKGRFQTTWGSKTGIGIFQTILRLADDIANGNKIDG